MKRFIKKKIRKLSPTESGKRLRLIDCPPKIEDNHIVFTSSDDYSGNPRALYLYMLEHGYNEKYKITWIFEKSENYREFAENNVYSVKMFNEKGKRTYAAQKAILSAKYIFYSHNVNWAKNFRKEQVYIDLWHGCGYKGDVLTDERQIYFDYCLVTGPKYIKIFKEFLHKPDGEILTLGYSRNDLLKKENKKAFAYIEQMKKESKSQKTLFWMPTYRKSTVSRLETDTNSGEYDLPLIKNKIDLQELDKYCQGKGILIILKQHLLQKEYKVQDLNLKNIIKLTDSDLRNRNLDLYEILGYSDALLTDYSSVAIDYMLLDKPIGYILTDYDEYEKARGYSFENNKEYMPGNQIYYMRELKEFLDDVIANNDRHKEWRNKVRQEVLTESESYSKDILEYFDI